MKKEFNIDEVNAWLKEQYGMSYDELLNEFNKTVDLLSESLKQRKELRDRINKANEYIEKHTDKLKTNRIPRIDFNYNKLLDILKEDK